MANFFDNMGQKARDMSETNKLNGELKGLNQQRTQMFTQLGQMLYNYKKSEDAEEPDYAQMIAAIDNVNANTRAIEERIAQIKGDQICPKCNGIVPAGVRFCPHCGGEMPVPQFQPQFQQPPYGQPPMGGQPPQGAPQFQQPPMGAPMGQPPQGAPMGMAAEAPQMQPQGPVCKNCGAPLSPENKFCIKCGTPTGVGETPAPAPASEEASSGETDGSDAESTSES